MPTRAHHDRRGMTLVELLVVIAIIGLLGAVVLPTLASSSEARKTREAARSLVSYIARSQSRVLGRIEWGGLWIIPVAGASYALDLFAADVPEVFQGDNLPTTVSGSNANVVISSSTIPVFVLTTGSIGGQTVSGSVGDLVRFDGTGPWYSLAVTSGTTVALRSGSNALVGANENANQTTLNTPWPAAGVPLTYELLRQPNRSGSPLTFADGRCVDVGQSGYVDSAGTYQQFNGAGSIAILFDGNGRLRQLVINGARVTPAGAVYLLVGRSDRAGNGYVALNTQDDSVGTNWQYPDSYWVGIDTHTGVVRVAECTPNAGNVVASQSYVRSELLATGR